MLTQVCQHAQLTLVEIGMGRLTNVCHENTAMQAWKIDFLLVGEKKNIYTKLYLFLQTVIFVFFILSSELLDNLTSLHQI